MITKIKAWWSRRMTIERVVVFISIYMFLLIYADKLINWIEATFR